MHFADYEYLPNKIFKCSIGDIKNVDELRDIILERYFYIPVGKSKKEIFDMGFTVRFFKLGELVNY